MADTLAVRTELEAAAAVARSKANATSKSMAVAGTAPTAPGRKHEASDADSDTDGEAARKPKGKTVVRKAADKAASVAARLEAPASASRQQAQKAAPSGTERAAHQPAVATDVDSDTKADRVPEPADEPDVAATAGDTSAADGAWEPSRTGLRTRSLSNLAFEVRAWGGSPGSPAIPLSTGAFDALATSEPESPAASEPADEELPLPSSSLGALTLSPVSARRAARRPVGKRPSATAVAAAAPTSISNGRPRC
jgi:hypothetical protein